MRVYVITTKNIGEEYIFNKKNRIEIAENRKPDNELLGDLRYGVDEKNISSSHQYYYKFGDNECKVVGVAYLPRDVDNSHRTEAWKDWLKTLCHDGDEYIFVLHDKDYAQINTPFRKIDKNTYVFLHEPEDWFYGLLEIIGNDITASDFNRKFNKLVTFAEFRQKVKSYIDESINPGIEFFRSIDNLLSTGQIYEQKFEAVNNDWNSIKKMLCEIRREINRRKYE